MTNRKGASRFASLCFREVFFDALEKMFLAHLTRPENPANLDIIIGDIRVKYMDIINLNKSL